MQHKRYYELDRLNVLYCLIVVFIHAFGIYTARLTQGSTTQLICTAFMKNCAFVVQGFMFLSAAKYSLIYSDKKINYLKFIKGRFKRVILPYIICVCAYYLVFVVIDYVQNPGVVPLVRYILDGTLSAQFYFVIAIVQFYVSLPLWLWLYKRVNGVLLTGIAVAVWALWLHFFAGICVFFDRIFLTYIPFWAAGLAVGRKYTGFKNKITSHTGVVVFIFLVFYGANAIVRHFLELSPNMLEVLHTAYCFSAIMVTYALFSKDKRSLSPLIKGMNELSFDIYLWHCLLLVFIDRFLAEISFTMLWHEALLRSLAVYSVIFVVSFIKGITMKRRKG